MLTTLKKQAVVFKIGRPNLVDTFDCSVLVPYFFSCKMGIRIPLVSQESCANPFIYVCEACGCCTDELHRKIHEEMHYFIFRGGFE